MIISALMWIVIMFEKCKYLLSRVPCQRDYETEKQQRYCKRVPTEEHPLRGTIVTVICLSFFCTIFLIY